MLYRPMQSASPDRMERKETDGYFRYKFSNWEVYDGLRSLAARDGTAPQWQPFFPVQPLYPLMVYPPAFPPDHLIEHRRASAKPRLVERTRSTDPRRTGAVD